MPDKIPTSSEHEKVSRDQRREAMKDLHEDAHQNGAEEQVEHRAKAGQWPGKELTRNTIPNADDDPDREVLPDDIQRDISQDGVTHDPATTERIP